MVTTSRPLSSRSHHRGQWPPEKSIKWGEAREWWAQHSIPCPTRSALKNPLPYFPKTNFLAYLSVRIPILYTVVDNFG